MPIDPTQALVATRSALGVACDLADAAAGLGIAALQQGA
jgi:hypothetical protein